MTSFGAPESEQPRPSLEQAGVRPQALEVSGLTVRFGGVTPVDGVSLSVQPGELVGLIGPNGAGKSTLIDAISGFVKIAAGTILLGGVDMTKEPANRRARAGLVRSWQSLEIFEDISVLENLQVGFHGLSWREKVLGLLGPWKQPLDPAGLSAVEGFGLRDDLQRLPGELSFSQRRVITTARALSLSPSIVLLDEPAAGMSDERRATLAAAIKALARERGIGVLLVDHDMPFVMGLCDRIVVLNFGKVICEGPPDHVRADRTVIEAYLGGARSDERHEVGLPTPTPVSATRAEDERPALIGARDLAVGYYGHPVVEGIEFSVHSGEIVALLGANRAGKTTTLLALAGVIAPLKGDVYWLGTRITERVSMRKLADQGLGFLTAERSVFQQLTVAENLRVGRCDVDRALSLFPELRPVMRRKVGLLSGGEQQMLGLARALARNPRVLLVDELSLGLAPKITSRLMEVLREAADTGIGVILVEQHVPLALGIADQVCVIAGGRMTLAGAVGEVSHRVDAAFLADVLGQSPAHESG
jgi:sulfate-transporting ATPase